MKKNSNNNKNGYKFEFSNIYIISAKIVSVMIIVIILCI